MPKESCPGLLLTLVSVFVGLCESGGAMTSSAQQQPSQPAQQQQHHPVCRDGLEFWSTERGTCLPCTRCAPEFTLSPCAVHKDAICGPLSALEIDWSFLSPAVRKRPPSESNDDVQRRLEDVTSKMFWRFPEERVTERLPESDNLVNSDRESDGSKADEQPVSALQQSKAAHDPRERRKSDIEDGLSWDWQTGALVLAVCACIVFFLVAGCSALVYARQWRRMKKNFEPAGLEEISARLNLMVKAELAELIAGAPMNPGDPETRCQYLEKLLDRKRETPVVAAASATAASGWPEAAAGNLYIEEGDVTTPRSKRSQISRIQHDIETILSQKTNQVVD
ncbi:tumor necrosis factor receptor superfamily member wengen [Pseudomyrmex gracilis]|uniref:tumor necrosis factor receptor superfamily member wengen n=1 Tax=Pseudomyrmex gracilis TaxID=219809 RepID=UPI000994BD6F|nr:tumor necrosis factor receptor superfamily member wengen [Pseudomyrmex gracilis]